MTPKGKFKHLTKSKNRSHTHPPPNLTQNPHKLSPLLEKTAQKQVLEGGPDQRAFPRDDPALLRRSLAGADAADQLTQLDGHDESQALTVYATGVSQIGGKTYQKPAGTSNLREGPLKVPDNMTNLCNTQREPDCLNKHDTPVLALGVFFGTSRKRTKMRSSNKCQPSHTEKIDARQAA